VAPLRTAAVAAAATGCAWPGPLALRADLAHPTGQAQADHENIARHRWRGGAINAYSLLKLVHVVAAIIAVGTNLTYFVWLSRTRKHPQEAAHVLPGLKALDTRLANPAYVVLLITGILMVLNADLGFTTFWIATAIGLYIALAVIAGVLFSPALRRQVELSAQRAEASLYDQAARRTTLAGVVTMLPIAAILYLMVIKPT
jgi:uncharacterized membrane protein